MNCFPKSQNSWIRRAESDARGIVALRLRREFVRPDRDEPGNGQVAALLSNPRPNCDFKFQDAGSELSVPDRAGN